MKQPKLSIAYTIFFIFSLFFTSPGNAQSTQDLDEVATLLNSFQDEISNVKAAVQPSLGPYSLNAQYEWCSERAWWGFGSCTQTSRETFDWSIHFYGRKSNLNRAISNAEKQVSDWPNSYPPNQNWIYNLPKFSRKFLYYVNLIGRITNEVRQTGNQSTQEQKQQVVQALESSHQELETSKDQVNNDVSALSAFLENQSSYRKNIKQAIDQLSQHLEEDLNNYKDIARDACSQQGTFNALRPQFDDIERKINNYISNVRNSCPDLEDASRNVENEISELLASIISDSGLLTEVIKKVTAAQSDEIFSFIQTLHLSSAKNQWQELAASQ